MQEAEEKGWSGEETLEVAKKIDFDWTTNPLTKFFESFLMRRMKGGAGAEGQNGGGGAAASVGKFFQSFLGSKKE